MVALIDSVGHSAMRPARASTQEPIFGIQGAVDPTGGLGKVITQGKPDQNVRANPEMIPGHNPGVLHPPDLS